MQAGFHIWPDLWKCTECTAALPLDFFKSWISQHVKDAALIGKPLILGEPSRTSRTRWRVLVGRRCLWCLPQGAASCCAKISRSPQWLQAVQEAPGEAV